MGLGAAVTASEEGIVVPLSGLSFHDGWFSEQRREGRRRKGWSESQSYSSDSWAGLRASIWVVWIMLPDISLHWPISNVGKRKETRRDPHATKLWAC